MEKRPSTATSVWVLFAVLGALAVPRWAGTGTATTSHGTAPPAASGGTGAREEAAPTTPTTRSADDRLVDELEDLLAKATDRPPKDGPGNTDPMERARATVAAYKQTDREFYPLLVSVPDPRQSHLALYYGQVLESLRRAFASVEYQQDRFWLRDLEPRGATSSPSQSSSGSAPSASEPGDNRLPGLLLFRKRKPGVPEALVLTVLVAESPVFGPDMRQIRLGLKLVRALEAQDRKTAILGPFFSGSAHSFVDAIRARPPGGPFSIVTGSATASSVDEEFKRVDGVTFQRTVATEEYLETRLKKRLDAWNDGKCSKIAVLSELGTGYGASDHDERGRAAPEGGERDCTTDLPGAGPVAEPRYFFPLHIAEVRADHERVEGTAAAAFPTLRRTLGLKFDPAEDHESDLPSTHSDLTPYEDELTLAQTLEAIQDRGIEFLVVKATDPVDIVFLAGELKKYCPNVALALVEHEEMFTHPDLGSTFYGAVVASTYAPSFAMSNLRETQSGRFPFPNQSAEGVYNAALTLLDSMGAVSTADVRLGGYRCDDKGCGPPLFISQVSGLHYWPFDTEIVHLTPLPAIVPAEPEPYLPSDRGPRLFFWPILAGAVFQLALRARAPREGSPFAKTRSRLLAVAHASLAGIVALAVAPLCKEWLLTRRFPAWSGPMTRAHDSTVAFVAVSGGAISVALLGLAAAAAMAAASRSLLAPRSDDGEQGKAARGQESLTETGALLAAAAAGIAAVVWAVKLLWDPAPDIRDVLSLYRLDAPFAMSSATPLVFLNAGILLWAHVALLRGARLERFPARAHPPAMGAGEDAVHLRLEACWRQLRNPWTKLSPRHTVAAALGLCFAAWRFCVHFKGTFEPPPYNSIVAATTLLVATLVAAALARFVSLTRALLALLRQLAGEPMRDAYDRIATKVSGSFGLQLSARVPEPAELAISLLSGVSLASTGIGASQDELVGAVKYLRERFEEAQRSVPSLPMSPRAAGVEAEAHSAFFRVAAVLRAILVETWNRRARAPDIEQSVHDFSPKELLPGGDRAAIPTPVIAMGAMPPAEYLWVRAAEDFVALRMSTFVYQVLHELRTLLTFSLVASFSIVLGLNSYPFRPAHLMSVVGWSLVVVQGFVALYFIIKLELDEVLSRLGGTRPDRIDWNAAFVRQMVLYVGLPLAAALTGLFPQLGDWLSTVWTPLTRAIALGN